MEDLKFYIGKIYKNASKDNDKITVRILPQMSKYQSEDLQYLPKFPTLQANTLVRGFAEADGDNPSLVLVLSNSDFSLGWVVKRLNYLSLSSSEDNYVNSIKAEAIESYLQSFNANPNSNIDIDNYEVTYQNATGNIMILADKKEPTMIILTKQGTFISVNSDNIQLCASAGTEASDYRSIISMTPEKISFRTKIFEIEQADKVILGHHGENLVGTLGNISTSVNGFSLDPVASILV